MIEKTYDVQEIVAYVSRERYVREFRDVATFEACCRECPNYGRRWGCPPFDHDTLSDLQKYEKVLIVGLKIMPHDQRMPLDAVYEFMRPEIKRMNERLLTLEQVTGGMAFGFVGECPYCKGAPCARIEGKPCRHPDLVRPSLEAYGFNVSLTASDLLGIEMQWGRDGKMPHYITLVCGLFYNGDDVAW